MIRLRIGKTPGASMRAKFAGDYQDVRREGDDVLEATVSAFRRAAVLTTTTGAGKQSVRLFVIEPADEEAELLLGELFVRGRFRVVEKVNNARRAEEAWRGFVGE